MCYIANMSLVKSDHKMEGSDTCRNLVHFQVKSLEISVEIRKSYLKSQSEILKLFEVPYSNTKFLLPRDGVKSGVAYPN